MASPLRLGKPPMTVWLLVWTMLGSHQTFTVPNIATEDECRKLGPVGIHREFITAAASEDHGGEALMRFCRRAVQCV